MKDDFSAQVGDWCDLAGAKARVAFLAIAYGALTRVKELTPVDTGYLRANWQVVRGDQAVPVETRPRDKDSASGTRDLVVSGAGAVAGQLGLMAGAAVGGAIGGPAGVIAGAAALNQVASALGEAMAGKAYDLNAAREPVAQVQLGEKLHIVNPTQYARAIEFGANRPNADGSQGKTAPRAMAQQTVAEMPDIAAKAIAPLLSRR